LVKVLKWLDAHFEESIMMTFLTGMVIIMGLQVVMRRVFSNSLAWPEELTRYLFIWMVCLGISYSIKSNTHIRIDILESFFPVLKKPFAIIGDIAFMAFCLYMLKPGYIVIQKLLETWQTSPAMLMPMAYVYVSLLIGIFLSIFRIIQRFVERFTHKESQA